MTEQEFQDTVFRLRGRMYGTAIRMGMSPDDAADVVQETLIRLWRSDSVNSGLDNRLEAYCMTSFRNEALRFLSNHRQFSDIARAADVESSPERDAEFDSTRRRIESLIDSLPEGQRDVVRLSAFASFSNEEIAKALNLTAVNVRQLLSRGRQRLRMLMKE